MMDSQTSLMHPCVFGITLQQGVQLVAAINIFLSSLLMVVFTIYLFGFETAVAEAARAAGQEEGYSATVFVVWVIFMIVFILALGNHILLLKGATEKSAKKIKIYLIICLVMIVLGLIGALTHTFSGTMAIITLLLYIPQIYELWLVFCFYKELMTQPQGGSSEYEEP